MENNKNAWVGVFAAVVLILLFGSFGMGGYGMMGFGWVCQKEQNQGQGAQAAGKADDAV